MHREAAMQHTRIIKDELRFHQNELHYGTRSTQKCEELSQVWLNSAFLLFVECFANSKATTEHTVLIKLVL